MSTNIYSQAIKELRIKYDKDPALLADVINALPVKMESSLDLHKRRLLGSLPKSRDEFDPWSLLMKLDGGNKITVLPANWKEFDMKEFLGDGVAKGSIDLLSEVVSTDEGITSSDAATTSDDDAMAGVNKVTFEGGAQTREV